MGDLIIPHQYLSSLRGVQGLHPIIEGSFDCSYNALTSLDGSPLVIEGHFFCSQNRLTNLHNIHEIVKKVGGEFRCYNNPIRSHMLGLCLIDGLQSVVTPWPEADKILNKYVGGSPILMLLCQDELIEAGFIELARL